MIKAKCVPQASIAKLEPNVSKIIAAICFMIVEAGKRSQNLSQYDIVKTLFLADKKHLNDYGRPITFDNYIALEHGPVPSLAYNLLKEDHHTLKKVGKIPWTRKQINKNIYHYFVASNKCDFDVLSKSDADALLGALTTIKSLTFSQIRQLTHNDPAYINAWSDETGKRSYPMDLALLFDKPDPEAARNLSFLSRHQ